MRRIPYKLVQGLVGVERALNPVDASVLMGDLASGQGAHIEAARQQCREQMSTDKARSPGDGDGRRC